MSAFYTERTYISRAAARQAAAARARAEARVERELNADPGQPVALAHTDPAALAAYLQTAAAEPVVAGLIALAGHAGPRGGQLPEELRP